MSDCLLISNFIRTAQREGLDWYICRVPGHDIVLGKGVTIKGIHNGFLFAPFKKDGFFTITNVDTASNNCPSNEADILQAARFKSSLASSTPREVHTHGVTAISKACSTGEKTVLSRLIKKEIDLEIGGTFCRLEKKYPEAFVFMFCTANWGIWGGASPETLIRRNGDIWHTEALAGTLSSSSSEEWDTKNIEEHQIVVDFIKDVFVSFGMKCCSTERKEKFAGPVRHLYTPMKWELENKHHNCESPTVNIGEVLNKLSPTPALCGWPYEKALQLIEKYEHHDRGLYGGAVGMVRGEKEADVYVNLRSFFYSDGIAHLFVGGGITHLSNPDEEWKETELKANTIVNAMASS